jgi:hypothetical protein
VNVEGATAQPVGHERYFALSAERVGVPIRAVGLGFAGATRGAGGWMGVVVVTEDELRLFTATRRKGEPPEEHAEEPAPRRRGPNETLDPEVLRVSLGAIARVDKRHSALAKSLRLTFTNGERLSLRLVKGAAHGADVARLLGEMVAAAPRHELPEGAVVVDPRVIRPGGRRTAAVMLGDMVDQFLGR